MTDQLDLFAVLKDQVTDGKLDDSVDYAEQLIGEDKKYKDVQTAARSLLYKDQHIARLEAEAAALRGAVKGEQKIDAFLDQLKAYKPAVASDPSNTGTPPVGNDSNQPTNQKALSLTEVEELLDKKDRAKTEASNYNIAVQASKAAFGADYIQVLAAKAVELSVSPEYLNNLAKTQPNLFIKLVGATQAGNDRGLGTGSTVNTAALVARAPSGEKTQKYYTKLRKDVGDAKFFHPSIQGEMHRQAVKLGEAFFD